MKSKEELKSFFENGDIPKQDDFWEWQDSYWHKNEKLPLENIDYDFSNKADLIDGKIPATQLPSYVDDILEFDSLEDLPNPGERGKIYVINSTNTQLRWSGSEYVPIISGHNVMITDSPQDVFPNGTKTFWTDDHNNSLHIKNTNSEGAGITFNSNGIGQIVYNDDEFRFTNSSGTDSIPIISDGFIKSDSSNDYVLTGGGGHKAISDFVLDADLSNYVTLNTLQTIEGQKFFDGASSNGYDGAAIITNGNGASDTIFPTLSFHQPTLYAGTLSFRSDGRFHFMNIDAGGYVPIAADGLQKAGSSDSYVLTGGGGHKPMSDFALSSQLGNYHNIHSAGSISNGSDTRTNKTWFDYTWAGLANTAGSVINFSGLHNDYAVELFGEYYSDRFGLRSHNGDNGTWNPVRWLWHSGNFNPNDYVDKTSGQDITGYKSFFSYLGGDIANNRLWVRSSDGSNPGISFVRDGVDNGQIIYNGEVFAFINTNSSGYVLAVANGFQKAGSDDTRVLLGGGGHKLLSELVDTTSYQAIIGDKLFYTAGGNNYDNNRLNVVASDGSNPAITFNKIGSIAGQLKFDENGYHFLNPASGYRPVTSVAFIRDGYDDNWILLAGGGSKQISDFWNTGNFNPDTKVNKSGDTMTGDLHALNITAQNAADTLTYDNLVNYGSPLKINANASLGIYLQANGTDILYIGPSSIQAGKDLGVTGSVTATGAIVSNNFSSNTLAGNQLIATNPTEIYFGNNSLTNLYYQTATNHIWQVNASTVASMNSTGLYVNGNIQLNGNNVATQPWVNANYTPLSHVGSGGTAHANATTSTAGFMSSADKTKLDNINTSNFVTINTNQTVTGSKSFADGSQVQFLGGDGNHIIPQRTPGGAGTIVSGHDYTHYNTRWRVGNVRGGSTDSTALGFFFSSDNGSSFSNRVSIDSANGQINTAIHGNSAEWNDIAQNGIRSGNNGFTTLQNYREIDDNTFDIDDVTVEKFNIVFNASANGRVVIHSLPNGQTYHLHNFSASNILRVDVEGYGNVDNIEPGETKVYMAHNSGHLRRISSSNTYSII